MSPVRRPRPPSFQCLRDEDGGDPFARPAGDPLGRPGRGPFARREIERRRFLAAYVLGCGDPFARPAADPLARSAADPFARPHGDPIARPLTLALELLSSKMIAPDDDPWPVVDAILRGKPPQPAYAEDIKAIRHTWANLPDERRSLLKLLSRFALTTKQARRWFDLDMRADGISAKVTDTEIGAAPPV